MPNYTLNSIKLSGTDVVFKPVGQQSPYDGEAFNLVQDSEYINENYATSAYAHAEGSYTSAGWRAHTEGYLTAANNTSHAEGRCTMATGKGSHAEGCEIFMPLKIYEYPIYLTKEASIKDNVIYVGCKEEWEGPRNQFDYQAELKEGLKIHLRKDSTDEQSNNGIDTDVKIITKAESIPTDTIIESGNLPEGILIQPGQISLPGFLLFEQTDWILPGTDYIGFSDGKLYPITQYDYETIKFDGDYEVSEGESFIIFAGQTVLTLNSPFYAYNFTNPEILDTDFYICVNNSTVASGQGSHAEGQATEASGAHSHAEGQRTNALNIGAHAEGCGSSASGEYSHAEGYYSTASGNHSHAEGYSGNATAQGAHSEGYNTNATNVGTHAEGFETTASGHSAHAEGYKTTATKNYSHAEGRETSTGAEYAHAEGYKTKATGYNSHAEGYNTESKGQYSHAEGYGTIASADYCHVQGKFNEEDKDKKYIHIIGYGTSGKPENIHTVDTNGNANYKGVVECSGIVLTSPSGLKYKLIVNDIGELSTEIYNWGEK